VRIDEAHALVLQVLRASAVPYAFIGAFGVMAWAPPRATNDLDLVVVADQSQFSQLRAALTSAGLREGAGVGPAEPTDTLPDIAVFWLGASPSIRIDIFIAKLPFERDVVSTSHSISLGGTTAKVASLEAMLVYKLLASPTKDRLDIESMLTTASTAGRAIHWRQVRTWAIDWGIEDRVDEIAPANS
jgi:hypothetical protein